MKKKIIIISITIIVLVLIAAGGALIIKINNNRLYKLIDEKKTKEALVLIEKMSKKEVNAYSYPLYLRGLFCTLTQGKGDVKLPLAYACANGDYDVIEALLKKGADPNRFLEDSWSPIEATFIRRRSNRLEIAKLLIEYGVDVNLYGGNVPALFWEEADIRQNVKDEELSNKIISLLIDNGAKTFNEYGYSTLHYSVQGNCVLITENLINNYNLPIDAITQNGQTPLMIGSIYNATDTVKLLIEHGADKTIKDNDGKTAYDLAVENDNKELAKLLKP